MNKKLSFIISLVVTYLVGVGAGYAFLPKSTDESALLSPEVSTVPTAGKPLVVIDPGEPKNQTCPLNGLSHTTTEKSLWEKRLSAQMASLPEFDDVFRTVKRAFR